MINDEMKGSDDKSGCMSINKTLSVGQGQSQGFG